jgi:hypothetical protein
VLESAVLFFGGHRQQVGAVQKGPQAPWLIRPERAIWNWLWLAIAVRVQSPPAGNLELRLSQYASGFARA